MKLRVINRDVFKIGKIDWMNFVKKCCFFILLTIITQIGGIVYVVYQPLSYWVKKRWNGRQQSIARIGAFLFLYLLSLIHI